MGAIFGFLGSPDQVLLTAMGDTLSHRGADLVVHEHPEASVGYRGTLEHPQWQRGLHVGLDQFACLTGWAKDTSDQFLQPASVLAGFDRDPDTFLDGLYGDFVAAVYCGKALRLVRDPAGIRTVFWTRIDGGVLFASEPKALLACGSMNRRVRPAAIAQFLTFSFIPGAGTMLDCVHELPAGHQVVLRPGESPSPKRYFFFEAVEPEHEEPTGSETSASEDEWVTRFSAELSCAVDDRLPGNEPFGVFLSGGLDSSAIAAELSGRNGQRVPSWSIHFGDKYPNELAFAREVAQRWNTDHQEVLIRPRDFLPRLRRTIWHLDDPIGDPITVPNFELARRVSKQVRWVFNGEGGDPLFGGPKNIPMLLHHWYGGLNRHPRFRERAYLASYRRAFDEIKRLLTPEVLREISFEDDLESLLTPFFVSQPPRYFLNKLCAINIRLKGAHLILPKVERMLAANGITSLSPLFDPRLIELSFAMPPTLKLKAGVEKVIIKRAFADKLPESVLLRPKSGMRVPVHYWFQKETRRFIKKLLSKKALAGAGIFRPDRVRQLLDYDTEEGPGRYGIRLWMLMTFELWRRIVIEREPV